MVSVQHIIIEAAVPTRESGPKTLKISRRSAVAAEDESIFTAPSDISSAGKPLRRQMGDSRAIKPSIAPEALNIDTAHKRPRRDGRTENTVFMPLAAPSVKARNSGAIAAKYYNKENSGKNGLRYIIYYLHFFTRLSHNFTAMIPTAVDMTVAAIPGRMISDGESDEKFER